jgi:hypothetical protein
MRIMKKGVSILFVLILLFTSGLTALAVTPQALDTAITDTAAYVYKTVKIPLVGSVGGEWAVMELARSGYDVPEVYYQNYYATVEAYVEACKGVLHTKKYTEYSRVTLALTAIGKDPRNVAGYNLLTPLGDYDKTIWQGLNGPIWALIALDTGGYAMPQNPAAKTQATRAMYIQRILDCQLPDGGWSLFGGTAAASAGDKVSDPDITGMALQALAKYQDRADVKKATDEALACMSAKQNAKGGYSSWGTPNSESVVQILVALCELGIPVDDARFVKNGQTLLDNLMTYYLPGKGFQHTADGSGSNQMATEQALYGLIAAQRARDVRPSLYRMSDALKIGDAESTSPKPGEGHNGRHSDVKAAPIVYIEKTFEDISGTNYHINTPAIEALAVRGIIGGKTETIFDPDATMTRAEFAAIIVRGLSLTPKVNSTFTDVISTEWYAPYVGAANDYGIINGATTTTFNPLGTINRQEAAVMVAHAAELAGMDTEYDAASARDIISQFMDYTKSADWARSSLAFCYDAGILNQSDMEMRPKENILRCEVAQMLFNMLGAANLL